MEKNQNILQVPLSKRLIWLNKANLKTNNLRSTKIELKSELFNLLNKSIHKKSSEIHLIQNKKHQISQLNTLINQNRLTKIYNECLKISDCYIIRETQKKLNISSINLILEDKNFKQKRGSYSKQQKTEKIENTINLFKQNLINIKSRENKCARYDGLGYNPQNLKLYYKHSDSNQVFNGTSLQILEKKIKKELEKYKYQLFNNFLYDQFIGE
jgi:ribosomal protein L29